MLRLPPFEYLRPSSADEAVQMMTANRGRAMLVAGGTDLYPNMKRRQFEPAVLVSLRGLRELRSIGRDNGWLEIGAGMTLHEIATHRELVEMVPALGEAVSQIANPQIQRMGTLGGNLCVDTRCNYYNQTHEWRKSIGFCMKKDGDICLVAPGSSKCWAISSSDTAPVMISVGARVILHGPDGQRTVPVSGLYQDDGIEYMKKRPDEILTGVQIPVRENLRCTYRKVRRRGSFDFPILGTAAALELEGHVVRDASLVLGAVHTHPVTVKEARELMVGEKLDRELIEAVADAAYRISTPLDNADLTLYWRKQMVRVEVRRAFLQLGGLADDE